MHMNHYGNAVDREFDPLSGKNIDYLIVWCVLFVR